MGRRNGGDKRNRRRRKALQVLGQRGRGNSRGKLPAGMEEKREEEEVLGLLIKEGAVVVVVGGEGEFNRVKDARGLEGSDGRGIMNVE